MDRSSEVTDPNFPVLTQARATMTPDWKKAKEKAAELLKLSGMTKPPIDPEIITEEMGIKIVYAKFKPDVAKNISGFIQFEPLRIVVNKEISPSRITFTIAHELGHYVLHKEYAESPEYRVMPRNNIYASRKPKEEQEADYFAAELLMPAAMVKEYKPYTSLEELARIFAVSKVAMLHRLQWLRLS